MINEATTILNDAGMTVKDISLYASATNMLPGMVEYTINGYYKEDEMADIMELFKIASQSRHNPAARALLEQCKTILNLTKEK